MTKCELLILLKEPEEPYDKNRTLAEKDDEAAVNKLKGIPLYLSAVRTTAISREALKEAEKLMSGSKKTFFSFVNTSQDLNYTGTM